MSHSTSGHGITGSSEFWRAVQAELDARRDPLDQPAVQDYLLAHPNLLEPVAELRASLAAMAAPQSTYGAGAGQHRRYRRLALAGAAFGLISALVLWVATDWGRAACHETPSQEAPCQELVLPDLDASGTVHSFALRHYTRSRDGIEQHTVTAGGIAMQEHTGRRQTTPAALSASGHAIITELTHLHSRVRPELVEE